jgi:hemolysin activation/secretion protein
MVQIMKRIILTLLSLIIVGHLSAFATEVPVSIDPKQVENKLKPEIEPGQVQESVITQQKQFDPNVPVDFYKKTIHIKRINLDGNTIFLDQDLGIYFTSLLGKEVSLASLYEIAEKITNHYRKEGYVLATAFIPEQELRNGLIKIKIVEGFISKINLEGDFERTKIIDNIIDKIYNIKPFNIKQFERYMLLLNELPGVAARAVLKKQKTTEMNFGGIDLDILFSKEKGKLGLGLNNSITKYIGNFLTQFNFEQPNLGLNNHTLSVGISVTDRTSNFRLINLSDKITINSEGTSLFLEGSAVKMKPGRQLRAQEIKVNSESASLNLSHPFIRSRVKNFTPYIGFSINNSRTEALSFLLNKDRLRSLNIGANYDFFDSLKGASLINASVSRGLDVLESSKKGSQFLSKEHGVIKFTKANFRVARMQNILDNVNLYLSLNSQHTHDTLLSSEMFSVGGANIGKGYDPSAVTGDNGYAFTTELRYKVPTISLLDSEAFCFYDYGKAWNKRKPTPKNPLAISYGAGLRVNIGQHSSAKLIIAQPTTAKVFSDSGKTNKRPTKILLGLYIRA